MSTLALPMTSPASPKRSFEDAGLDYTVFKNEAPERLPILSQSSQSAGAANSHSLHLEPFPLVETNTMIGSTLTGSLPLSSTAEKPAKRIKLSDEEKEAKRIEKEAKDRQKAEEKARKEGEKAKKDAEKAIKEEERRKAKEAREEQARLKEEEKQRKEEEKMKKARVCVHKLCDIKELF